MQTFSRSNRFGTGFSPEDRVFIERMGRAVAEDEALVTSIRVNTPENARLAFDHVVTDRLQDMVDTNFKLYKRVTAQKPLVSRGATEDTEGGSGRCFSL